MNSNNVADLDECMSLSGYVFMLTSDAVSQKASLYGDVALSSIKAKYMALTFTAKEMIWLRGLLLDFELEQKNVSIYYGKEGDIYLVYNINIKYHFI